MLPGLVEGNAMVARRRVILPAIVVAATVVLAPLATAVDKPHLVVQGGTYSYLATPDYTGVTTVGKVAKGQTMGLGTFDRLDGELVLVGGEAFRIGTDGVPTPAPASASTPFLQAVKFAPTQSGPVPPGTTCAQLLNAVNALAGTSEGMVAVRVRGTFTSLTTRSVPGFDKPYPTLTDAVAQQTVFDLGQRKAVLVGFRTGPDFAGTGAPGLHLHGVTADRQAGGHVLSCVTGPDVQLSIDKADGVTVVD